MCISASQAHNKQQLKSLCTSVLPPHRGRVVPSPMKMGRNGRRDLPRGSTKRSPPLSRIVFWLGCSLTGHNWAAPQLIDRTPFDVSLSWLCSLLVAMSMLTRAPLATILTPGTPAPSATLMWVETLFSALLASSGCTSSAPPLPVLTFAQSLQLALQWVGVAWRATPKAKLAFPLRPVPSLQHLCPLHLLPQGSPPLPPGFYQSCPLWGPPRYPYSMCSLKVGKDSLKCSTCSKWVHFTCSSLTRADFHKICGAGSPMGWNCPVCLNGDLASTTHLQASPRPVSPAPSPPKPPTNMFGSHKFISISPLTSSPP